MAYRLTASGVVQRIADGAYIPTDTANGDYQEFLAWAAQGNEPSLTADPASAVPQSVTRRQAWRALQATGLLSVVQSYVDAADEVVRIDWETAAEYRRSNQIIATAAAELGWTEQQLDQLFTDAAAIEP